MNKQALIGLIRKPTLQELYRLEQEQVELSQGDILSCGINLESDSHDTLSVRLTQYLYRRPYYWGVCSLQLLNKISTKCQVPEEFLVYYHNRMLQEIEGMLGKKHIKYIWYMYNKLLTFGVHHRIKVSDRGNSGDLTHISQNLQGALGQNIKQCAEKFGDPIERSYKLDYIISKLSEQSCKYTRQKIDICQEFQGLRETMGKIQQ